MSVLRDSELCATRFNHSVRNKRLGLMPFCSFVESLFAFRPRKRIEVVRLAGCASGGSIAGSC